MSETQVHVECEAVSDAIADGAASIALVREDGVHLVEAALASKLTPRNFRQGPSHRPSHRAALGSRGFAL